MSNERVLEVNLLWRESTNRQWHNTIPIVTNEALKDSTSTPIARERVSELRINGENYVKAVFNA